MLYTFYEDLYDYGMADLQNKKVHTEREVEQIKERLGETDDKISKTNSLYWQIHGGPEGMSNALTAVCSMSISSHF